MKYELIYHNLQTQKVAPLVGAWIEMTGQLINPETGEVAPLVGAWIEI